MKLLSSIQNLFRAESSGVSADTMEGWFSRMMGGAPTASGVRITEENSLQIIAVFACVRLISESLASLPLTLYQRNNSDPRVKAPAINHPLFSLLKDAPNSFQTSFEWREMMQGHNCLRGNGYSLIMRSSRGVVGELIPLHPDKTTILVSENGKVYYENSDHGTLAARKVLHLRGFGTDGYCGLSPITIARESLGITKATENHAATLFGNGASPRGVLKVPKPLSPEQRGELRNSWREIHKGNTNDVGILHGGMEWQQIGLTNDDAQFLETRKFGIQEIARLFNVPPHLIQDLERATFSNIEHQAISFVVNSLRPWLVRWEQRLNASLLREDERGKYFFKFTPEGLLRGDIKSRYEAYAIGRQWGWLSANDVRELEDRDPIDGGDRYDVPLNMEAATKDNDNNNDEGDHNDD